MLEPEGLPVGTVNEDFAVESLQGDIFQLGNTSYRILRVERGTVRVEDAHGLPPSIPFWLGEAPGRTRELSAAVSRRALKSPYGATPCSGRRRRTGWPMPSTLARERGAANTAIPGAGRAALRRLPSFDSVVFERFFDESGGMQLVIHSPSAAA